MLLRVFRKRCRSVSGELSDGSRKQFLNGFLSGFRNGFHEGFRNGSGTAFTKASAVVRENRRHNAPSDPAPP